MTAFNLSISGQAEWLVRSERHIASISAPQRQLDDIPAAIDVALSNPIDFPSLDQAIVAGDQLALVVDPCLPALVDVVASTLQWFCQRGMVADNIRVVLAAEGQWDLASLQSHLEDKTRFAVVVEQHAVDDMEQLAYVAANEASEPIYLHRSLVDADVVIPLSCARNPGSLDYFGAFSLFPLLSNRATRGEFYSLPRLEDVTWRGKLQSWADQAAWWLGIMAGIQVVPAADDGVARILAGQLQPLERAAQAAMAELWSATTSGQHDLVIAALEGASGSQSWLSVARALFEGLRWIAPQGSLVIVSGLRQGLGSGLGRLRNQHQSPETLARRLASDTSDDALPAAVILEALASNHVYLVSHLRSDTLENLGLGCISSGEQLNRLIAQHNSGVIIEGVQHRTVEFCPT